MVWLTGHLMVTWPKQMTMQCLVQKMLMVVRATPSKATKISPHFAVTGRQMDPGILDTKFPLDQASGLSKQRRQEIQDNIEASKKKARERENQKKNRIHLHLQPGDEVLVRLGQKKLPEKEHYEVVRVNGNEITTRNKTSGRVLRRHLQ